MEHEALERMISLAHSGRAMPVIGLALAEATFGSWLAGEDDFFEGYRTSLVLLVERYDIPALLRFTLAVSGRAPPIGRSTARRWDARAFLIAAAEKVGGARGRLREALALCDSIESAPLRDSVAALAERGDVRGMLAPLVNRLRHRASIVVTAQDVPLMVSFAEGTVSRGEERIDVSEGVLALVLALAVEAQSVTRERLVDRLWPDLNAESAYNALQDVRAPHAPAARFAGCDRRVARRLRARAGDRRRPALAARHARADPPRHRAGRRPAAAGRNVQVSGARPARGVRGVGVVVSAPAEGRR
jgi:hypothetical protein